ncbi:MAG: hypothetical protein QNJ84_11775 [Alphaproteobacteria bacterium]|nr:hypothetical protein [Alphaproteobacteria bacterium]
MNGVTLKIENRADLREQITVLGKTTVHRLTATASEMLHSAEGEALPASVATRTIVAAQIQAAVSLYLAEKTVISGAPDKQEFLTLVEEIFTHTNGAAAPRVLQ